MQYAGYYNLYQSDRDARKSESRRGSSNTTSSSQQQQQPEKKSTFKKMLDQFKATEEDITPSGIYAPIIKRGPLFEGLKPAKEAQTPSPIYQRERPLFGSSKRNSRTSSLSSTESVLKV